MDYVFGTVRRGGVTCENLKTVGDAHTDLTGSGMVRREYADSTITDCFVIGEKYRSENGADGQCYDWYTLTSHYRYEDRYTPGIGKTEQEITDLEIKAIEQSIALTDAEIAIFELQQAVETLGAEA